MTFSFTATDSDGIAIEEKIRQAIEAAEGREYGAGEIADVLGRAVLGEMKKERKEGRRDIRDYLTTAVLGHAEYSPKEHAPMFPEQIAVELLGRHDLKVEELMRARIGLHEAIVKARPELGNMDLGQHAEETACRLLVQQAAEIQNWKAKLVADLERLCGHLQGDRHYLNTLLLELFPEEFTVTMLAVAEETTVARVSRKLRETKKELDSAKMPEVTGEALNLFRKNLRMKGQYSAVIAALSAANPSVLSPDDKRWTPALEAIYKLRAESGIAESLARAQIEELASWFADKMPDRDTKGYPVRSAIELMDLIAYAMPQIVKLFVDNVYSPAMSVLRQAGIDVDPMPKGEPVKPELPTGREVNIPVGSTWPEVAHNG